MYIVNSGMDEQDELDAAAHIWRPLEHEPRDVRDGEYRQRFGCRPNVCRRTQ
ncbi:hypothetical protein C8R44DRAFT_773317 [Mycena epipterygia]|nr:hypothetical protein C8R44DRAFT_773317 [Mycena epipterygia]